MYSLEQTDNNRISVLEVLIHFQPPHPQKTERPAGEKQDWSGFYLVGAELRKAMFSPVERSGAAGAGGAAADLRFFFCSLLGSRSYLRMLRTEREPRGRGDVQAFSEDT